MTLTDSTVMLTICTKIIYSASTAVAEGLRPRANATLTRSTVSENGSQGRGSTPTGGGISAAGDVTLIQSTVSGNFSGVAGGIAVAT